MISLLISLVILNSIFCDVPAEWVENTKIAYAAMCEDKILLDWSCYWCTRVTQNYTDEFTSQKNKLETFFFSVVQNDETLMFSFRGSANIGHFVEWIINYIMDFDFKLIKFPGFPDDVRVHQGFYESYKELSKEFFSIIDKYFPTTTIDRDKEETSEIKKIKIMGHSLGAAMSVVATADLLQNHANEQIRSIVSNGNFELFTIGLPRVGNSIFSHNFEKLLDKEYCYRLTNQRDPIPHIPPRFMGYHHVPFEYWFQNNTKVWRKCDGSGEDPKCSDSQFDENPNDHCHYLGIDCNAGAKEGCG